MLALILDIGAIVSSEYSAWPLSQHLSSNGQYAKVDISEGFLAICYALLLHHHKECR